MMKKIFPDPGFVDRLNQAVGKSEMSISEVAKKIEIARKTMNDYLEGISAPNSMTLAAICRVLNVSADYLLLGKWKEGVQGEQTGKHKRI